MRRGGWINGIGSRRCDRVSVNRSDNDNCDFAQYAHKVNKVIEDRKNDVKETYRQADEAKENAEKLEAEYTSRLEGAKEESAQIIQTATRKAQQRSDEIISEARTEAKGLVDNASREIEREKKIAVNQIKNEITDIAFSAAAAVVEKDMTGEDNERLIEKFIDNVGEM